MPENPYGINIFQIKKAPSRFLRKVLFKSPGLGGFEPPHDGVRDRLVSFKIKDSWVKMDAKRTKDLQGITIKWTWR
ncbi:MAG: hypothetical protein J5518_03620, partial [Lachnospiraceae bacterium]|nr:hypothetical protein [Lachnospiraceae bacterium]